MAWSWSHFPKRVFRDGRFLRLDDAAQTLLLRLYAAADRHGRGPTDPDELAVVAGALAGIEDFEARMGRLLKAGLVRMSACGRAWQIDRYDEDAPKDVLKGRPKSDYPEPAGATPVADQKPAGSGTLPDAPGGSGKNPEKPLKAGRQAGRRSIASLGSPPGPPEGPGKGEPTPAASTDARATSAPTEPDPEPRAAVASPPALGGAGEAPCGAAEEQQQDPEPPPRPRPRPLTRAEEAERVRQLREQLAAVQAAAGGAP